MRSIMTFIFLGQVLLANSTHFMEIKDNSVKLKINGDLKILHPKDNINLNEGDTVCFVDGGGRAIVDNERQLSKNTNQCYIIPVKSGFTIDKFVSSMTEKVLVVLFDSSERVRHGVSSKGTESLKDKIIELSIDQDLLIHSDQFGPLPVTIQIRDEKNNLLQSMMNETQSITFVHITKNMIKNNYHIIIMNGFNQVLLNATLKVN